MGDSPKCENKRIQIEIKKARNSPAITARGKTANNSCKNGNKNPRLRVTQGILTTMKFRGGRGGLLSEKVSIWEKTFNMKKKRM